MKLVGLMPVRNEDWVLGLAARVALMWVDHLIILIHSSSDDSLTIAWDVRLEHPDRVTIMEDARQTWHEMQMRQHMLEAARKLGALHIALIDADEVLTGNLLPCIRIEAKVAAGRVAMLPGYNLRGSVHRYHSNGVWGNRQFSTAFEDDSMLCWSGDKFHSREPKGKKLEPLLIIPQGEGGVMHLWGASLRRLTAKHALYKIVEHIRWPDKSVSEIDRMYSWAIHGGRPYEDWRKWEFASVPESWWKPYEHLMKYLDVNKVPWQEAEAKRLVSEYGKGEFSGLDLFGVA